MGHPDKKVILHIDDEPEMLRLVEMILGKHNYKLEKALSGDEAMERMNQSRPDLVLLDIAMPIMDGWAVRQWMMDQEHLKDVPVVVLTAKLGTADAVQGLHGIEADAYLTKPFNPQELIETIRRILSNT